MPRWRSTNRATWIISSPPTPSGWVSISTSITSPLRPTASSTAISSAASIQRNSPRSPAAPAAPPATAVSAPPGAVRPSTRNSSTRSKATQFEPVKVMQCPNSDLDFSSLGALAASLAALPPHQGLTRAPIAEDILVFEHAARDEEVRAFAKGRAAIERLWDVCQIPDYRKISPAAHAELVATLYGFLLREGRISDDWFARQIAQADHIDGDIDTLSTRIAHIRTWTFAANRPDWLGDPEHWQGATRAIEDRLSDALHERLAERFVDRRTSVLMRRLRENTMLDTEITKTGEGGVEGHAIGRLDGFRFAPDTTSGSSDAKALSAAAQKALAGEMEARANQLAHAPDAQFVLTSDATI